MWSDAVPNLLIGLREGLEAGLIISILIAAVVKGGDRSRLGQLWAGVACAAALSLAFGAVLTYAAADLSTTHQEAIGGILSLIAVVFVTWMVFWMRRTARTLSSELRSRTEAALAVGGPVLFVTAFLAVAREGLETALFLWSTTRTASESTGPLLGALVGLTAAACLCWALYRQALRINLSRFFTWTGAALIVISAGVAGYGLRELQGANIVGGGSSYAINLSHRIDPTSAQARIVEGVFNLTPTMTVVQVIGYLLYLVPVLTVFVVLALRSQRAPRKASTSDAPITGTKGAQQQPRRVSPARLRRRPLLLTACIAAGLVILTGTVIVAVGPKTSAGLAAITITDTACAPGWKPPESGRRLFNISNRSSRVVEVYLMGANRTTAYGEIEGLAPGTTRSMSVGLPPGAYVWRCIAPDGHERFSAAQRASGSASVSSAGYLPVSAAELDVAKNAYRSKVATMLNTLASDTDALAASVQATGASPQSKALWLKAHLDYLRLGAAYGTFGEFDAKINGRPNGLPAGVNDPAFTGFLRLEHEMWNLPAGANPASTATQLATDVRDLVADFPKQQTDRRDLPLRAHEILENGVQFELTGIADHGSHTALANLRADVDATQVVLTAISPALASRNPALLSKVNAELDGLATALDRFQRPDGTWVTLDELTLAQRQAVNGAVSQMVEDLAPIPDILELPPSAN